MRRPKAKVGDLVRVRWRDASRIADWTFSAANQRVIECDSVGWLTHADKTCLTVRPHRARDVDGDEQHFGDMTIPRGAVVSLERLA